MATTGWSQFYTAHFTPDANGTRGVTARDRTTLARLLPTAATRPAQTGENRHAWFAAHVRNLPAAAFTPERATALLAWRFGKIPAMPSTPTGLVDWAGRPLHPAVRAVRGVDGAIQSRLALEIFFAGWNLDSEENFVVGVRAQTPWPVMTDANRAGIAFVLAQFNLGVAMPNNTTPLSPEIGDFFYRLGIGLSKYLNQDKKSWSASACFDLGWQCFVAAGNVTADTRYAAAFFMDDGASMLGELEKFSDPAPLLAWFTSGAHRRLSPQAIAQICSDCNFLPALLLHRYPADTLRPAADLHDFCAILDAFANHSYEELKGIIDFMKRLIAFTAPPLHRLHRLLCCLIEFLPALPVESLYSLGLDFHRWQHPDGTTVPTDDAADDAWADYLRAYLQSCVG